MLQLKWQRFVNLIKNANILPVSELSIYVNNNVYIKNQEKISRNIINLTYFQWKYTRKEKQKIKKTSQIYPRLSEKRNECEIKLYIYIFNSLATQYH